MNEQIEQYVITLIGYVDAGVDASIDFLSAEIPLYIQELLVWYAVKSGVFTLFGVLLILATYYIIIKNSGAKKDPDDFNYYVETLTHDPSGEIGGQIIFTIFAAVLVTIIAINMMSLEWLQIWLAPRVWLLEYATSLAK